MTMVVVAVAALWQIALMWAFTVAFWGLLIWAIYALITSVTRKPVAGPVDDGARRILDGRLARGEIDASEYRRLRDAMADEGGQGEARLGRGKARVGSE